MKASLLLAIVGTIGLLLQITSAIEEVTFYQHPVCNGELMRILTFHRSDKLLYNILQAITTK
jgi:hypothetical protein